MELTEQLNIRLTEKDLEELKKRAKKEHRTVSAYTRLLIEKGLEKPIFTVDQ